MSLNRLQKHYIKVKTIPSPSKTNGRTVDGNNSPANVLLESDIDLERTTAKNTQSIKEDQENDDNFEKDETTVFQFKVLDSKRNGHNKRTTNNLSNRENKRKRLSANNTSNIMSLGERLDDLQNISQPKWMDNFNSSYINNTNKNNPTSQVADTISNINGGSNDNNTNTAMFNYYNRNNNGNNNNPLINPYMYSMPPSQYYGINAPGLLPPHPQPMLYYGPNSIHQGYYSQPVISDSNNNNNSMLAYSIPPILQQQQQQGYFYNTGNLNGYSNIYGNGRYYSNTDKQERVKRRRMRETIINNRGRRLSSFITSNNNNNSNYETENEKDIKSTNEDANRKGVLVSPHKDIPDSDFYRHADNSFGKDLQLKQIFNWCLIRELDNLKEVEQKRLLSNKKDGSIGQRGEEEEEEEEEEDNDDDEKRTKEEEEKEKEKEKGKGKEDDTGEDIINSDIDPRQIALNIFRDFVNDLRNDKVDVDWCNDRGNTSASDYGHANADLGVDNNKSDILEDIGNNKKHKMKKVFIPNLKNKSNRENVKLLNYKILQLQKEIDQWRKLLILEPNYDNMLENTKTPNIYAKEVPNIIPLPTLNLERNFRLRLDKFKEISHLINSNLKVISNIQSKQLNTLKINYGLEPNTAGIHNSKRLKGILTRLAKGISNQEKTDINRPD
ncbi:uncharacterized protein SCODWIG_02931 [Saccharomycodes ludwigii]|uniref:Uncharacterized protein n=1 Tax=Saccharomycodes ludwigii TaxID=36035 RepID=A0A376BAL4_9ASCO|nr:hypothetical protein SCDLUD_002478 [Saccharomycodes ludwigii]KAH3901013.1 hypothetical protein SCDLUD_002478 [Saccharomycodes ludwigii]SSD61170.1 uncharacterized protein SCODWIG_02931 [Saccharomycodes ludwigii]